MALPERRSDFARHCLLLALLLEVLVLLALLSGAFPFALANPIWYLRLSDAAVNLAPLLLLALVLLQLPTVLLASDDDLALRSGRRCFQLSKRWGIVFAALVPLQLLGAGWLWIDSERQLDGRISQLEGQRTALLAPLLASTSETDLRQRLAAAPADGFPPPPPALLAAPGSLAEQKQRLSSATEGVLATLRANLRNERTGLLRNSFPGSLRVLIGATLISALSFTLCRQLEAPRRGGKLNSGP